MSARNYVQTIAAGASITLPAGRYFFVRVASAVLDITTKGNTGSPVSFVGVGAGTKFGPVAEGQGWRELTVSSATLQNVEIIISDDGLFDVANTVTVSGAVATIPAANTTVASPASIVQATGGATTIAANASRKALTLCALSTNTGSVFVQAVGAGAGRGIELQPGTAVTLNNTAAVDIRNDSGANQTVTKFEET